VDWLVNAAEVKSVGNYFMRLFAGVAVIVGILGVFGSFPQGNLVGVAFSVALIADGAVLLKRSSRSG
jgi:hypothetical protein